MVRKLWPGIAAILAAAAFGAREASRLPARVPSHWDIHGNVNGYMPRTAYLVAIPILGLVTALILAIAPRLDPKRRNFPLHAGSYWVVANTVVILLAALHVVTIGYSLGWPIDINAAIGIGLGILLIIIGNVLTRVRPNWIFGVRTPWTLSSDLSWRETHRVAGYLFVAVGVVVLILGASHARSATMVAVVGVFAASLVAVVWSYFAWKRDPNAQGREA